MKRGWYGLALRTLQKEVLPETDACYVRPARHSDDLITDCDLQKKIYWSRNEISVLLNIAKAEGATSPPPFCHHHRLCAKHAEMCRAQTHR